MEKKDRNLWIWGFTCGAETWNGRLAMLGFIALVITELLTEINILAFLGILR
uniref:CAB/ELIP/HLIP superfamily protein n=1 Tax=Goniotrichopsis reniformis TaxID=468933 RepID=UPI001FCD9867|nr:CAB/ELIP/HLIP superfamily protein [Goniotrichopsis reniformis]UNJ14873.1 CAB/ELIP/HLIP superfamily protein [Goniotrichopsis reniformis]